ncbi:MAG: hypothetical protein RL382_999 [Actinomycetota bacterium]|jgi:hypothetical protein
MQLLLPESHPGETNHVALEESQGFGSLGKPRAPD